MSQDTVVCGLATIPLASATEPTTGKVSRPKVKKNSHGSQLCLRLSSLGRTSTVRQGSGKAWGRGHLQCYQGTGSQATCQRGAGMS